MYGTPPGYSGYQAMPAAGHAKRKRGNGEDLEEGEMVESSKRMYSKAVDAPSPV